MKTIPFFKYSANGNDFIILPGAYNLGPELIQKMCHRQFGIGADGVLVLTPFENTDGEMKIYNADGFEAEMCGNGLRALVTYIHDSAQVKKNLYRIKTMNHVYEARVDSFGIAIEMSERADEQKFDLSIFKEFSKAYFVNTGVPHLIFLADKVHDLIPKEKAPFYRFHPLFPQGTNVTFVGDIELNKQSAYARTYERGVEDETFSCGTGLTATAIALQNWFGWKGDILLKTKGGDQRVQIQDKILYSGVVNFIFKGEYSA